MNNPCYNKKTKTDCQKRCVGCAKDCPEWTEYVRQRDVKYEERKEHSRINNDIKALNQHRDQLIKRNRHVPGWQNKSK